MGVFLGIFLILVMTGYFLPDAAHAIAVGLSIGVMYCTRCIHPPGGATALVSGQPVYVPGYDYVYTPDMLMYW